MNCNLVVGITQELQCERGQQAADHNNNNYRINLSIVWPRGKFLPPSNVLNNKTTKFPQSHTTPVVSHFLLGQIENVQLHFS